MRDKKAFTLVEMLAVVVVLAIISVFTFPAINTINNNLSKDKYDRFIKVLNNAADSYIELNFEKYNNIDVQYIDTKKLIENGFLDENLINPKTKVNLKYESGIIVISKNVDKSFAYEYILNEYITIDKIEDLLDLSKEIKNGNSYLNKIIILTDNLDFENIYSYKNSDSTLYGDINGDGVTNTIFLELTTIRGFSPIGDSTHPFKGTFVGDGHLIDNIYINRTAESYLGLFSSLDGAKISDLKLKGEINGNNNTGLLAGAAYNSNIVNVDVNMTSEYICTNCLDLNIGGLIGFARNIILKKINSNSTINIQANNIGGVIGWLENSQNITDINSSVTINGNNRIGAAFGMVSSSSISNIISNGKVTGIKDVGGIVGTIQNTSNVLKSNNKASIIGTNKVGGLVGNFIGSKLELSYNNGEVSGGNEVGGLVGGTSDSIVNNCYSWGNVKGNSDVGGLIGGSLSISLNNSYSVGNVIGSTLLTGGLVGNLTNSTIKYSYFNLNKTSQTAVIGTMSAGTITSSNGLSDDNMKNKLSYAGWDFTNVWFLSENSYPLIALH
ncbi:MAG: prepilin-type N-terminal cleavage/methylation domain-containing protein [Bacilli bacterium]